MKIFEGKIISTAMTNTVVVEVLRITPHPLYRKLVKSTKKYKVDTNGMNDLNVGSVVEITEIKPMSKDKYFKVTKIVGVGKAPKVEESKKQDKETEKSEVNIKASVRQAQEDTLKVEVKAKSKTKKTIKPSEAKSSKDKKENK